MTHPMLGILASWKRLALGLCVVLIAPLAWADVDQGMLERVEGLLKAGRATPLFAANVPFIGLGSEVSYQLTNQWSIYGGGDYRDLGNQMYHDSDYATLDGSFGVGYSGGGWLLRTGLSAGQYNLNQERPRTTSGATLDWRMALNDQNQFSLGASYTDASYQLASYTGQNTQTTALTAGWLTALGGGSTVFSLTGAFGIERGVGGRDDGDRRFYGPRLSIQTSFADRMGAYASAGVMVSRYDGTNAMYLFPRNETLYDLTLGMTWSFGKGLSVRPQFSAIRNNSNADLYSYDKNDWTVNLRFDF